MKTWITISGICLFAIWATATPFGGSDNKDPDKYEPVMAPGCNCPLVKGYSKQYCKSELEEMNTIAKMPTVQTNCVENFVYMCQGYGKTAWIAEKCPRKSKCGKAGLALVGKYQNFTINASDRRICLTEDDQSMAEPLPTNLAVEYGVKPVPH